MGARRAKSGGMVAQGIAEPVVRAMSAEVAHGGLRLADMAEIAHLSPCHFVRVFQQATGLAPGSFQAALPLAEAKRRLGESDVSVTEVCFDLGYASLGSFVTRFTSAVGLSPARYRRLVAGFVPPATASLASTLRPQPHLGPGCVTGELVAGAGRIGPAFVGLFSQYLPQGLPLTGTALAGAGRFVLGAVPSGTYAVLAAACPGGGDVGTGWLHGRGLVVAGQRVQVAGGRGPDVRLALRPAQPTDPPVLIALPLLLARAVARSARRDAAVAG